MATNFMAASAMKTLRLFIGNDLTKLIKWNLIDNINIESGFSSFEELSLFSDSQVEIYIDAACITILRLDNVTINKKRLTDELILGMLEDNIADEIDEVVPITLTTENNTIYVAIFDRYFYNELHEKIELLNKPIKFLQSIAHTTYYEEDSWTLYLSSGQNFLRTSKYEYYLLDDNKPIPISLENILMDKTPFKLIVYCEDSVDISAKLGVTAIYKTDLELGLEVWNLNKTKARRFNLALNKQTVKNLKQITKNISYILIIMLLIWLIQIITLSIRNSELNTKVQNNLQTIEKMSNITIDKANNKLLLSYHERGIYTEEDALPLIKTFLEVVSNAGTNSITKISFSNGKLEVLLNSNFNHKQFTSYKNIFLTKRIDAIIKPVDANWLIMLKRKI